MFFSSSFMILDPWLIELIEYCVQVIAPRSMGQAEM
jgi:hypothetical protein